MVAVVNKISGRDYRMSETVSELLKLWMEESKRQEERERRRYEEEQCKDEERRQDERRRDASRRTKKI